MGLSPFLGSLDGGFGVGLPEVGNLLVQGVVKVGGREEGLDGEEHRSDLQGWAPLVLQDIQANSACKTQGRLELSNQQIW